MADLETSHATLDHTGLTGVGGDVAAHEADTTSVHGITNTANLYASGGTDVAVADGGTGASSASAARTNLGLVIGTDVDAFASTISQAEAEAGSATTVRNWTAQRVAQAIAALAAGGGTDLDAILAASSAQDIAAALLAAAAPDGSNPFATMADVGVGGGTAFGQAVSYPTSFTGDTIDGSDATPFADVAAFDTKAVENSRILHLQTKGASKDQRVRVTLGTTKAAAFDVRLVIQPSVLWFSTGMDSYIEVRLSTSADAQLAIARIGQDGNAFPRFLALRVGGSTITSLADNYEPTFATGLPLMLRFIRDGSNNITFWHAEAQAPMALSPILERNSGTYGKQESVSVSGTLARIEIAHHTPSGPSADFQVDTFIDYVASV